MERTAKGIPRRETMMRTRPLVCSDITLFDVDKRQPDRTMMESPIAVRSGRRLDMEVDVMEAISLSLNCFLNREVSATRSNASLLRKRNQHMKPKGFMWMGKPNADTS
jgi:hypothetical protein